MRSTFAAALGALLGGALVFLGAYAAYGSAGTAALFSSSVLGFFVPVLLVFGLAGAHPLSSGPEADSGPRRRDAIVAACYMLSLIPFWFCVVGAIQRRLVLASILFGIYAAMAAVPLRSMLRVRRLIEGDARSGEK